MDINLEYYKIFYYTGRAGSITLAAAELSLSQPAVSQAIRQLEKNLGSPLFIRTSKGVRLTKEGEVLYQYIKRGYDYIKTGEKKFQGMLNLENGEINIGASDMTLKYFLLPYLEKFHEVYPDIKFRITNAPTPSTLKYIQEGLIDFGVVSSPVEEKQGIVVEKVRKIEDIFVAGEKYLEYKGRVLEYSLLEQLPIICLENNTSTRHHVDQFLEKRGIVINPEFELAISDMLVQFALRNLGIAAVVKDFAMEYIKSGELFQLQFTEKIPDRRFCIITNSKIPISAAASKLLEGILNEKEHNLDL